MTLNHLDLSLSDVPAATTFFSAYFGMRIVDVQGKGSFAILSDDAGMTLVLSTSKPSERYPRNFHVGFIVEAPELVYEAYERLRAGGVAMTNAVRENVRGIMFYCTAPGGVMVEVSCRK